LKTKIVPSNTAAVFKKSIVLKFSLEWQICIMAGTLLRVWCISSHGRRKVGTWEGPKPSLEFEI